MLTIYISPCPNDTFSFYHYLTLDHQDKKEVRFEDIQSLNERAIQQKGDVIKISFAAYPLIQEEYVLLESGSALGQGCGPLLISKKPYDRKDISNLRIALPGSNTTANRLFCHFYPHQKNLVYTTYDQVMSKIESGDADAGVIIHENRFTYQDRGFAKIADLGELWAQTYEDLLPLGGIAAKRSLGVQKIKTISNQIAASIQWAFQNRENPDLKSFIEKHAQELNPKVINQHIDLYVNEYSIALGKKGRQVVGQFLKKDIKTNKPCFSNDCE